MEKSLPFMEGPVKREEVLVPSPRGGEYMMPMLIGYRGTSPIINHPPPPQDPHKAPGMGLLYSVGS